MRLAKEAKTQSAVIYDTKKEAELRIDETPCFKESQALHRNISIGEVKRIEGKHNADGVQRFSSVSSE